MKACTLRLWDEKPHPSQNMNIVTRLSDLGSPLSYKSLLGFYIDIKEEATHTPQSPTYHVIKAYYRENNSNQWVQIFTKASRLKNPGVRKYKKNFLNPIKNVHNVQIKVNVVALGKLSINDFGLVYREHRKLQVTTDED